MHAELQLSCGFLPRRSPSMSTFEANVESSTRRSAGAKWAHQDLSYVGPACDCVGPSFSSPEGRPLQVLEVSDSPSVHMSR